MRSILFHGQINSELAVFVIKGVKSVNFMVILWRWMPHAETAVIPERAVNEP